MTISRPSEPARRSDAQRNRLRILDAARTVFTGPASDGADAEQSMAEIARRAGVGRGTLYRNFPTRRDLLEALFYDEVESLIQAAVPSTQDPGHALLSWLHRFATFEGRKHPIAAELLEHNDGTNPMFAGSRQRVIAAGEPLLVAAQLAGDIRPDITVVQALDLVLAIVRLDREPAQVSHILDVALDGLRT